MEQLQGIWASKREGQHFLMNRELAEAEAEYAKGMRVLEMGAGLGILTSELCQKAKHVTSVEKDKRLYEKLKYEMDYENLTLIEGDFFDMDFGKLGKIDIMVSNIPYALSSKVVSWLGKASIPAVLCIQKEFAEHMCAKPGTRSYSRLSVMSSLKFRVYTIREVPATYFRPRPKVESALIYVTPKKIELGEDVEKIITMLMNHKKKSVRNAVMDSKKELGLEKTQIDKVLDGYKDRETKVFKLQPEQILEIARKFSSL